MNFEKLSEEKFGKIEKNELGKLVGGTCPGYTETAKGSEIINHQTVTYSCDWDNSVYDAEGNLVSGSVQFISGEDMSCPCGITPGTK